MAGERDTPVRTVLRGEALQRQLQAGGPPAGAAAPAPSPTTGGGGTPPLINGVPASAAIHCCGRGCAHCRIHWRKNGV